MDAPNTSVYRFADFELQPRERRLLRSGVPVALTPKALDLLEILVSRAGHIVTKDELLSALWPKRYVTEANLTKLVWTVRRVLGEGDEGGRFIATVPKAGYRFVAPVAVETAATQVARPVALSPTRTIQVGALATFAFAVLALSGWWLWNGQRASFPWSTDPPGTVVAIVAFDNLANNRDAAWIGPAFVEMLGTDIALGGRMHLVPDVLVHDARNDLPVSLAAGFSPTDLGALRRRLATDFVVTGSYWAPRSPGAPVKLDLTVQDARSGVTIATLSRSASIDNLPDLVASIGADLRKTLGAPAQTESELRLAANAEPSTVDLMRRIGNALDALHHFDPSRARDELLQAVAQAPGYAPAYAYLSKAWAQLGYHDKALAASSQAMAHDADLPRSLQLAITAQNDEVRFDWPGAIASLRALDTLENGDPEVEFELVDVLSRSGNPAEAQRTLDDLRAKGGTIAADPRLELAAAQLAADHDDTLGRKAHAQRALALATARDQTGLVADAERQIGIALTSSDAKGAEAALNHSIAAYRAVGNPRGEADDDRDLGNLLSDTEPKRAQDEYRRSLAAFQALGDQNGIAAAYSDLGSVLWAQGDRDGARVAVENVLRIRRETGDAAGQAWALAAIAVEESDDSASDAAIAGFREAASIDARIGAHAHRGFSLYSLSDVLRLRGNLADAASVCAEAQAEYANVSDLSGKSLADFECAQIALDRGDVRGAQAGIAVARASAARRRDLMGVGNADLTSGQIAMGEGRLADAAALIGRAASEYKQGDMTTGQAVATSVLALCDDGLGNAKGRDSAIVQAATLRSQVTEKEEVFQVDVAQAALRGGKDGIDSLEALAADASQRHWPGWALEVELLEVDLLRKSGDTRRASSLAAAIEKRSRALGFGWTLKRLAHKA